MPGRYYVIEIFDSTKLLFQRKIPIGQIGPNKLRALLTTLVAKHGLCDEEVVTAHLNKNCRSHRDLLNVQQSAGLGFVLICGDNPHGAVRVVDC